MLSFDGEALFGSDGRSFELLFLEGFGLAFDDGAPSSSNTPPSQARFIPVFRMTGQILGRVALLAKIGGPLSFRTQRLFQRILKIPKHSRFELAAHWTKNRGAGGGAGGQTMPKECAVDMMWT